MSSLSVTLCRLVLTDAVHNDIDSLELCSSTWLTPMALTTCNYHGRHRHIAKAYTAGKTSSCSKLLKLSVISCGYETMHACLGASVIMPKVISRFHDYCSFHWLTLQVQGTHSVL